MRPRTALITGAARGLGRVFAAALAGQGIAVAGIDIADTAPAAAAVAEAGGEFAGITADITDPDVAAVAVGEAAERLGGLDILVNNAGIYPVIPFAQTTPARWRQVMSLNLDGLFYVTSAALPWLTESRAGRIVNIASAVVWLGPARHGRVYRVQGRGHRLHPCPGQRARPGLHHGQRDHAEHDRDRDRGGHRRDQGPGPGGGRPGRAPAAAARGPGVHAAIPVLIPDPPS